MQSILRVENGCVYRRALHEDLIPVMEINLKTLPEHYSDYFYESIMAEFPESFLVALVDDIHVGYIMCKAEYGFSTFRRLGFVKKGHLVSVSVLPEYRKRGVGGILVNEAIKGLVMRKCVEMYLEVRCSNNGAVRLYEGLGFVIKQQLKSYYRDGEDAFMMAIELEESKK